MRRQKALILAVVALSGAVLVSQGRGGRGGTAIGPNEECPPGTTETRPRSSSRG